MVRVVQTQDMERHGPILDKAATPLKDLDPILLALHDINEGRCLAGPFCGLEKVLVVEFRPGLVVPS